MKSLKLDNLNINLKENSNNLNLNEIPEEIYNFYIGGYQPCKKWMKYRKLDNLTYKNIIHFHKIVFVLSQTIKIMEKIDLTIKKYGGWPIK